MSSQTAIAAFTDDLRKISVSVWRFTAHLTDFGDGLSDARLISPASVDNLVRNGPAAVAALNDLAAKLDTAAAEAHDVAELIRPFIARASARQ